MSDNALVEFFNFEEESKMGYEDSKEIERDGLRDAQRVATIRVESYQQLNFYEYDPPLANIHDRRSVLGRGSFGTTYRMTSRADGGNYAVKQIVMSDAEIESISREMLLNEAKILQRLNNPHIVRYYTCFYSREENVFSVVMELVSGGTIASMIGDENVILEMIVRWWTQLASALCYMHNDMKIQHRDIKPENILLTADWLNIKIIDLGLACIVTSRASTRTVMVGTSTYFSFEKACDIPYDGRDDVWAAGCVIAELMTRHRLRDRGGAIWMHHNETVNDRRLQLIADCVAVDARYGGIVGRMLEAEQVNRCSSSELLDWLSNLGGDVDVNESFEQLLLSANSGNADAQYAVGVKFWDGVDVDKSYETAFKYFKMAADQSHADAQGLVGRCYYDGIGVTLNQAEAVNYFKLSNEKGSVFGRIGLGDCYKNGTGVCQNSRRAFGFYLIATESGNAVAQNKAGWCFYHGIGVEKNDWEAFLNFELSANQENTDGQNSLGYCYDYGIFVTKNPNEAFRYYKKSADGGNSDGQCSVGICYFNGIGVEKNNDEAFKYFKMSVDQGNTKAFTNIGYCYDKGYGVEKDEGLAFLYCKLAADQGDAVAQCNVGLYFRNGFGTIVNESEAKKYLKMAAEQGQLEAQITVANLLKSSGANEDNEEAKKYFKMAADQGLAQAKLQLDEMDKPCRKMSVTDILM